MNASRHQAGSSGRRRSGRFVGGSMPGVPRGVGPGAGAVFIAVDQTAAVGMKQGEFLTPCPQHRNSSCLQRVSTVGVLGRTPRIEEILPNLGGGAHAVENAQFIEGGHRGAGVVRFRPNRQELVPNEGRWTPLTAVRITSPFS